MHPLRVQNTLNKGAGGILNVGAGPHRMKGILNVGAGKKACLYN